MTKVCTLIEFMVLNSILFIVSAIMKPFTVSKFTTSYRESYVCINLNLPQGKCGRLNL